MHFHMRCIAICGPCHWLCIAFDKLYQNQFWFTLFVCSVLCALFLAFFLLLLSPSPALSHYLSICLFPSQFVHSISILENQLNNLFYKKKIQNWQKNIADTCTYYGITNNKSTQQEHKRAYHINVMEWSMQCAWVKVATCPQNSHGSYDSNFQMSILYVQLVCVYGQKMSWNRFDRAEWHSAIGCLIIC